MRGVSLKWGFWIPVALILCAIIFSFPVMLAVSIEHEQQQTAAIVPAQFPVTVDPQNKLIVESAEVNAFFESKSSPLQAAIINVSSVFTDIFDWIAITISDIPFYQRLAGVAGSDNRFVTIAPGMRKEQVAATFASSLGWNVAQKKEFMTPIASSTLPLVEGSFSPGIYLATVGMSPREAQVLVNERFTADVLSRYGPETEKIVPLNQALTIASLIEREAGGPDDRRLISGIIWNRLFINMHLQIDATLQYAKANTAAAVSPVRNQISNGVSWWPRVLPRDLSRKSPYNTYLNPGLPPTPIANPSVASVLAALNPKNTSCLFYFHDSAGRFHCSETYAGHVALLKKYFGRGK